MMMMTAMSKRDHTPGVLEEGPEPVGVEVDGELGGEEEDEEEVHLLEDVGRRGAGVGLGGDLRRVDVEGEVLRGRLE